MLKKEHGRITIRKILYILTVIGLIFLATRVYARYTLNNFNDFIRAEYVPNTSEFIRDHEVRYQEKDSYKMESPRMNDAMFYQTITVTPNTPYKVTCMVKTENVQTEKEVSIGGAHISIADTVEKSESIVGTNDWTRLEFIFNSKNREQVDIGFRLGGYDDNCMGTAWFSDFTMEAGSQSTDTNWNFACFVFQNTKVEIEKSGQKQLIEFTMNVADIQDMKQNMARFKTSCESLSKDKMSVDYDFITITDPITSLSYDDQNGYFVAPENIKKQIKPYLEKKEYDHIFVCVRLGDEEHKNDIPVYDWIGLGGMDYLGVGFSNIRLPNDNRSYIYRYDSRVNTFPEEVFVHEFLHSLERNAKEYGYEVPALHDYANYNYKEDRLNGLKKWYEDYMNSNIHTSSGKIGINSKLYYLKPNDEKDFKFSYQLDAFHEPSNIFEQMKQIIEKAFQNVNTITKKKEGNEI